MTTGTTVRRSTGRRMHAYDAVDECFALVLFVMRGRFAVAEEVSARIYRHAIHTWRRMVSNSYPDL